LGLNPSACLASINLSKASSRVKSKVNFNGRECPFRVPINFRIRKSIPLLSGRPFLIATLLFSFSDSNVQPQTVKPQYYQGFPPLSENLLKPLEDSCETLKTHVVIWLGVPGAIRTPDRRLRRSLEKVVIHVL